MQDTTHTILRSAKRFFSGTMLSRISGMLRDMSMAAAFGVDASVAAFLMAFRFAHLLRRLLGEGAMQAAFIPHFEGLRKESPERAVQFVRDLTKSLTFSLTMIILISMGVLGSLLVWGNLTQANVETVKLTLMMMPSLLFICLFGINASLLQCGQSYFTPSVAPVAFNFMWILGVLLLWYTAIPTSQAMAWLSGVVIVACLCQWVMTVPMARKIQYSMLTRNAKGRLFASDVKKIFSPLCLGILGVAATQINSALDMLFARYAESEGPALLWYAIRLEQLPLALFGIAISGAVLPPMTRAIKNGDVQKFHEFYAFAMRKTTYFMIPITLFIFLAGSYLVKLLYGHGEFNEQAVIGTTHCLWGYALGLLPMTYVLIQAPAFYAMKDYRTPALIAVIVMAVNVGLNALMIFGFHWGAVSVAIGTSFSALINSCLLYWQLSKKNKVVVNYI